MTDLFAIDAQHRGVRIQPVLCKNESSELQAVLEANPDLLVGAQINPEDPRRWLLVKREAGVADPGTGETRWSIDHLFVDQDAIPTLVECKRFSDTRSRREVVAQMIDYAANGHHYWQATVLRRWAEETAGGRGRDPGEELAALAPNGSADPDEFFDDVIRNLRDGRVRLVFFLEQAPFELKSMVDFMNRQMERAEVLLIEATQYELAGHRIVAPSLFGYTEEARRAKRAGAAGSEAAPRARWTLEPFLADAETRLGSAPAAALERLHRLFRDQCLEIGWGAGKVTGSMLGIAPDICHRAFMYAHSDGRITWNFGYLDPSEAAMRFRDQMANRLRDELGFEVPEVVEGRYLTMKADVWIDRVSELEELIVSLLEANRKPSEEQ